MAISGLVLTLTNDEILREQTLLALAALPALTLGERDGLRLPVVADTRRSDRALFAELQGMDGVHCAEVAYVWFDDEASPEKTADTTVDTTADTTARTSTETPLGTIIATPPVAT